jgi:quercetin dioxygenase-like cupin family protein
MIHPMAQDTISEFAVSAGSSRRGEPLHFLGETVFVKVSHQDTSGAFEVIEELTQPESGPPLHLHKSQDEWLYVLEGTFVFDINGQRTEASAGSSAFLPKGVPHTFQNVGNSPGKLLAVVAPAGIERFFQALAESCAGGPPEPMALQHIFQENGVELLGPPLAVR